uniref:Uncharacterized protein n=1 Tax=Amphimedon queenslandica TaxID=400682 RepID=A0A1X7UJT1_AMPQE
MLYKGTFALHFRYTQLHRGYVSLKINFANFVVSLNSQN